MNTSGAADPAQVAATSRSATQPSISAALRRLVMGLGLGGLVPFVTLAGALWAAPETARTLDLSAVLIGYAGIILSFLGAIHWARALSDPALPHRARTLVVGVAPAVLALGCLAIAATIALPLLAALFTLLLAYDRTHLREWPAGMWYVELRTLLSAVVVATLCLAWLALVINSPPLP